MTVIQELIENIIQTADKNKDSTSLYLETYKIPLITPKLFINTDPVEFRSTLKPLRYYLSVWGCKFIMLRI